MGTKIAVDFANTLQTNRNFSVHEVLLMSRNRCEERLSGELRNGSELHEGFYDLMLFFPVSSFILILGRCV